ncbi:hypothetical protein [Flavobacterium sp. CLA17]|uniref:hypothetical protein n=1 Tax=Flavobacterium sp. CLA17 TaxID=2724135 RepID=UPI0017F6F690|nr:hypothetical protein [Flavobacterium sp. CLA17]QSB29280.1 hypothetical protein HAV12_011250 [Flavobacterium sp. CLA17]
MRTRNTALPKWLYITLALASMFAVIYFTNKLLESEKTATQQSFFFLLLSFGVCVAILIFSITEIVADVNGQALGFQIKAGGPFGAFVIVVILGLFFNSLDDQKTLNVQIQGSKGLPDIPIKTLDNGLILIPSNNNKPIVADVDSKGVASFELAKGYYEDSIQFKLSNNEFKIEGKSKFLITESKSITLFVSKEKTKFVFKFYSRNEEEPLKGIRVVSEELALDAISNNYGTITHLADVTNIETYHFQIVSANYAYKGNKEYYINQTKPLFYLDEK